MSLAPKISVEEARVDWSASAVEVDRRVRGCTPDPGRLDDVPRERVKLGPVTPVEDELPAGRTRRSASACSVGTAHGHRWSLGTVQPAGKKAMGATDWARGTRPRAGGGVRVTGPKLGTGQQRDARAAGSSRTASPASTNRPQGRLRGAARGVRRTTPTPTSCCPGCCATGGLNGRDAAFATELAYGVLRGRGTYDALLATLVDRPLAELDAGVLDVLRMGLHQLLAMRVPDHAAVATSVALARNVVGGGPAGLVNAVLRSAAGRDLDTWIAEVAATGRRGRRPRRALLPPAVDRAQPARGAARARPRRRPS